MIPLILWSLGSLDTNSSVLVVSRGFCLNPRCCAALPAIGYPWWRLRCCPPPLTQGGEAVHIIYRHKWLQDNLCPL